MSTFIQPSFARGEIAPALYGRVDTEMYHVALRKARNCIVRAFGGISNRPGKTFLGPTKEHSYAARIIPFRFKTTDTYMLEFGATYMRVMRDGGHVLETAVNITGATAADPVVVTAVAHGYSNGDEVYIDGVVGMIELNTRRFIVANKNANDFELTDQVTGNDIDGSAYTAYSSAGTAAKVYEITTLYAQADLAELKFTQSADTMTLTHPSYRTQELTRTGHAAWTIADAQFIPDAARPTGQTVTAGTPAAVTVRYRVTSTAEDTNEESLPGLNNTSKNITGLTAANPAVATAVAHGFADGDEVYIDSVVGMTEVNERQFTVANKAANTFELEGEDSTAYTAYSSGGTANQTFVEITNGNATPDNTVTWTAVSGAQRYAVYREDNGLYGLIGETELVSFLDDDFASNLDISPPRARDPLRNANNYPGAVSYYEQRRVFGGTLNNPDTSYYCQTGRPNNLSNSIPAQADDAITVTLNAREVNDIRHYVPLNDLLVFTSGAEWRVNSGSSDNAFTTSTIKQKVQSDWGCSHLRPIIAGEEVLFVTENQASVRSFKYKLQRDGYTGSQLSLFANHLFEEKTIDDWTYASAPDPIIYHVMSDGTLVCLTFQSEQEVVAWSTWDTNGKYEACATLKHSATQAEDIIYFVIQRTINGETVRHIEVTHSRQFTDVRDAFFVDCGASYDAPVTITNATAADPVVISATAHGFSDDDEVDIFDITWVADVDADATSTQPDQLNTRRYTVANKTANTFELNDSDGNDIDGSAFNAYVSGGTARKAVTVVRGLNFLEGEEVAVLADGNVISGLSVASGSITLPRKFSRVHVGLSFVSDIVTLDVEAPEGTIQGKAKVIPAVTVRFEKSRGLFIGPDEDALVEMKQREYEKLGDPTALLTGDKKITLLSEWNTNGRVWMRQRYPLPMTVLASVPDIQVGDEDV